MKRLRDLLKPRRARCGACGSECDVTPWLRRDRNAQFRACSDQDMDQYYCRCQDDDPDEVL